MRLHLLLAFPLLASACGPGGDDSLPMCDDELCTLDDDQNPGYYLTVVHAPDKDIPTFFSFTSPDDPVGTDDWDLSFARTTIAVNGGFSGDGEIEVAIDALAGDGVRHGVGAGAGGRPGGAGRRVGIRCHA